MAQGPRIWPHSIYVSPWLLSAHPDNPVGNQTWRYSPPDEAFLTMPLAGVGMSYPLSPGTFALPFGLAW